MSETAETTTEPAPAADPIAAAKAVEDAAEDARAAAVKATAGAKAALDAAQARIHEADAAVAAVSNEIAQCDPDDDPRLTNLATQRAYLEAKQQALVTRRDACAKVAAARFDDLRAATLAADETRHARLVAQAQAAAAVLDEFTGEAFERIGAELHAVQALLFQAHKLARDIAQRQGRRGPEVLATHGTGIGIGAAERIEDRLSKALAKRRT